MLLTNPLLLLFLHLLLHLRLRAPFERSSFVNMTRVRVSVPLLMGAGKGFLVLGKDVFQAALLAHPHNITRLEAKTLSLCQRIHQRLGLDGTETELQGHVQEAVASLGKEPLSDRVDILRREMVSKLLLAYMDHPGAELGEGVLRHARVGVVNDGAHLRTVSGRSRCTAHRRATHDEDSG